MTRAYLISPDRQTIEPVELAGRDDIVRLIGFETVESDAVGDAGDTLFFDEECFIRGAGGRFRIDRLVPVAGKGVVVGVEADGSTLRDVDVALDDLRARTQFD